MASEAPARREQPGEKAAETQSAASVRGRALEQALVRAGKIALTPASKVIRLWRRSIQARVVIGTLALSAILSILAGWILLSRVADGLLESKRQAAISQTAAGVDTAQSAIDSADISNQLDTGAVLNTIIELLSPRDSSRDDYFIAITGPTTVADPLSLGGARGAGNIDLGATLPDDLVE